MKKLTSEYLLGAFEGDDDYRRDLHAFAAERQDHVSITAGGEPCTGILRHWGTCDELIAELEWTIERIKELKKEIQK